MNRKYTYTVTNKRTGEVVVEGDLKACASATGINRNTLYDMATGAHSKYNTAYRNAYCVTRRQYEKKTTRYRYYAIYNKETDEILACGSAAECAKGMGWKDYQALYQALSRERRSGDTPYEFYIEDVDDEEEDDA